MFSKNTKYILKFILKAAFFLFVSSYIKYYLFLQSSKIKFFQLYQNVSIFKRFYKPNFRRAIKTT